MAPDQDTRHRQEELVSLNADDMDVERLDDMELKDVSGGTSHCSVAVYLPDEP